MTFFVYVLESEKDGSYYVGSTNNFEDRIERHNQGRSQYTKTKRPWQLVYTEEYLNKSDAIKRENQIKRRKSKNYIDSLIAQYTAA